MITATLIGDDRVIQALAAMPARVQAGLVRAVTALSLQVQQRVQEQKLSGQVLRVRTGTLRRSITATVETAPDSVIGTVGTNVPYGRAHEYGFHGVVTVKAHLRTITKAFGRALKEGSKQISVGAHPRQVNLPERSFLRSALKDLQPQIEQKLAQAVTEAMQP
jgi:phage gpG-like protein